MISNRPITLSRDWSQTIPTYGKDTWLVKDVARFLWQRFICDGLKHHGTLERAHLHALLAAEHKGHRGVDLGLMLSPEEPERVTTSMPLRAPR